MLRKLLLILFITVIPMATLILAAIYHMSPSYQDVHFWSKFPPVLTAFASLSAVYSLCLVVLFLFLNTTNKSLVARINALEKTLKESYQTNKLLQTRIELLSAQREVALILTQDVDFQTILRKTLEITAQLPGLIYTAGQTETEEVTIFLKDEISGLLAPQAMRLKDGSCIFEGKLANASIDQRNINEALEHQRLFFASDGEIISFAIPLIADRDTVGVLSIKAKISQTGVEAEQQTKHLQNSLLEFARLIALAVKTPLLYSRMITDSLTGLFSKRHFFNELPVYFEIARRHNDPFSLVMIDIDHFKQVNDTYGHLTGDRALKEVSDILRQTLRKTSTAYRYGGEEIAVILPQTTKKDAFIFAERVRKKIEQHKFTTESDERLKVTISLGIAEYTKQATDYKEIISRADAALYQAKHNGRNRTIVATPACR
ncbi:MAG: sensor domain-containing diguanylate cyclase [Planctomycetes bacterium]|nr:sensor domain-containing diguanylate cyclase [Planctomycetota bacterium]